MVYTNRVWGALIQVTKMSLAENGQKVDDLEPIYIGKYRFWWKMICAF